MTCTSHQPLFIHSYTISFSRLFRTLLWAHTFALAIPVQSVLLRMLACWPAGQNMHATTISENGFMGDPAGLLGAIVQPEAASPFGLSQVPALFGGQQHCFTGTHAVHAGAAVVFLLLHSTIACCVVAVTGRPIRAGVDLHLVSEEQLVAQPGKHLFVGWELYFEVINISATLVLVNVLCDLLPPLVICLVGALVVLWSTMLYVNMRSVRERHYETLVFACMLALAATASAVALVLLVDGPDSTVDVSVTMLAVPALAVLAGSVISHSRHNRAATTPETALVWCAETLQWINARTRVAAQAFLAVDRRNRSTDLQTSTHESLSDEWQMQWQPSGARGFSSSKIAVCRQAMRPVVRQCRGILKRLLVRYPTSAMAHLAAAEYLSSPVVSDSAHEHMYHVQQAWRLGAEAPWHRAQCWQHLHCIRLAHIQLLTSAAMSERDKREFVVQRNLTIVSQIKLLRSMFRGLVKTVGKSDPVPLSKAAETMLRSHSLAASIVANLAQSTSTTLLAQKTMQQVVNALAGQEAEQPGEALQRPHHAALFTTRAAGWLDCNSTVPVLYTPGQLSGNSNLRASVRSLFGTCVAMANDKPAFAYGSLPGGSTRTAAGLESNLSKSGDAQNYFVCSADSSSLSCAGLPVRSASPAMSHLLGVASDEVQQYQLGQLLCMSKSDMQMTGDTAARKQPSTSALRPTEPHGSPLHLRDLSDGATVILRLPGRGHQQVAANVVSVAS